MRFIVLSEYQATKLRKATEGEEDQLRARRIDAGEHAGKYALPERVMEDEAHAAHLKTLGNYPIIEADPATLWPPQEKE